MDKELKFAEKYNWWTREKENISFETKLSYILSLGSSQELFYVFRNIDTSIIQGAFSKIQNDNFVLKPKRKAAITKLLKYKTSQKG